jgi:hypothetical protein
MHRENGKVLRLQMCKFQHIPEMDIGVWRKDFLTK